jgi:hypothetical protein
VKDDINHPSNAFNARSLADAHATYDKLVWIEVIPVGSEVNILLLKESPKV